MSATEYPIRASWKRSLDARVDRERPSPIFVGRSAEESLLLRAARPVLSALAAELGNEPASIILTDKRGVVLQRDSGDSSLLRKLDRVDLCPGFDYSESEVGTNGIGTALEMGASVQIDGRDHYAGVLRDFSCAGAIVTHPTTGAVLGVVDITTSAENSNPLLLAFAKVTAQRIQERVLEIANELGEALLFNHHAACQHSEGPVLAVGENLVMMNASIDRHFDANDQAALLRHAKDASGKLVPGTLIADLPSGAKARLSYRPVVVHGSLAGEIIRVTKHDAPIGRESPRLPVGLADSSAVWRHVRQAVVDAVVRNEWVILRGEPGTGKLALIAEVHELHAPMSRLAVVDAAENGENFIEHIVMELDSGSDVVIRRGHLLTSVQLDSLAEVFQTIEDASPLRVNWVALTVHEDWDETPLANLLHFFPRTVSVPPLRHHPEDIPELVRLLLNRAGATNLSLSRQALHQLVRLPWPNNVTYLNEVLRTLLRARRSGIVQVGDLPPECQAVTLRKLSRLEALECDAIVKALRESEGDKTSAAESLGMSRATIYRKIRKYGIVKS